MRVIARIPDVSTGTAAVAAPSAAVAGTLRRAPRRRSKTAILARVAAATPTWPVAALAVIAVATWGLASWNDHARLRRQRSEVRLAREQVQAQANATAAGGAVVR